MSAMENLAVSAKEKKDKAPKEPKAPKPDDGKYLFSMAPSNGSVMPTSLCVSHNAICWHPLHSLL